MIRYPEKIFNSSDFTLLSEKSLISLIERDDLQMKEIEVWEHVIKWGLAQNPTFNPDPKTWSDDDFKIMKSTLQKCLPLIRFFSLSSKELTQTVRPYQKLLNQQLFENLVDSYMDPDSKPDEKILLPRNIKVDGIIESEIVNLNIVSVNSRCIDKVDTNCNFSYLRELYLPYKFELILRGSRDGFTPKGFHTLCDDKYNTVTFIKVKGTEEILGGYNPLEWKSTDSWGKTKHSFIFSFKNKDIRSAIISNVDYINRAIAYNPEHGPQFGDDIIIYASRESKDYDFILCRKLYYERKIRDSENYFNIENYEVFEIIRK
ncbi:hypothetical protein RclHR1_03710013 [Rhizophagus clarus]|uniref:TLDc domain-containing protein n=1 Tax=Rhizophagus clarus TaxID=94130 RepID=A0A2Z6S793_9GLOM|nr:hypothetical protein RclHR1_03710013 [Rhizophagus clarus]GES93546.1 hypothetical protein GLOIN_2v1868401 [Rhizophagus clarus]